MKTHITDALQVMLAILITTGMLVSAAPMKNLNHIEAAQEPKTTKVVVAAPKIEKPAEPAPAPVPEPVKDPNGCEPEQYWAADPPHGCIDKPAPPAQSVTPTAGTYSTGSGDCASELGKYDWNVSVAHAVMMQESANNPGNLNNNPATGDYSVGCFQINLYGRNALTRPSEAWLKNAANNVSYAYGIYTNNGKSFLGQWGACHYVSCY